VVVSTDEIKLESVKQKPIALNTMRRRALPGTPGGVGFGVGICPASYLPAGMTGMTGYDAVGHDNYGNYQFSDGSIMVFIPKFYYRVGHTANHTYPIYGVNSVDIKPASFFADTAAANAAGYALHRAFIDGGGEQAGFFVDKYKCSKNALGSGFIASSIKNGLPLSSSFTHNPFAGLTGGANYYYSAIDLAHRRDCVNGNVNASSIFFCCSRFIHAALAMLSLAHGQAAVSTENCAWYHPLYNYPKGCNKNVLTDYDDASVLYVSDGYFNCGKTGSGIPFAKTTHNGQACGVADINGLMFEISIGITCIASTKAITGATRANPCVITSAGHGLANNNIIRIGYVGGMVQLNEKMYKVANATANTFELAGVDSSAYTAYTSGGEITKGVFYAAKQATAMKTFTKGNTASTDHWGATGIAAMMESFAPSFKPEGYGVSGVFAQRIGSGNNQVLSGDISGPGWLLAGLGLPKNSSGMDITGTDLFGKDGFYQCIMNEMCLKSYGDYDDSLVSGIWSTRWSFYRIATNSYTGFRAACYGTP
jgi:hypothetical protein